MTTTSKHYYIVEVTLKEVKAFDGKVITKAGANAYLSEDDGFEQISSYPKQFKKPPSKAKIASYDGMPWYNRIETAKVIEINEKITHTTDRKVIATY